MTPNPDLKVITTEY